MRGVLLLLTAFAAVLSASAEWSDVTMDVYRNWFGEELPHLEVMEIDRVKPDITLKLDEPTARNVYGQKQTNHALFSRSILVTCAVPVFAAICCV